MATCVRGEMFAIANAVSVPGSKHRRQGCTRQTGAQDRLARLRVHGVMRCHEIACVTLNLTSYKVQLSWIYLQWFECS